MLFGKLDMNPALNPAILDTATWDAGQAWRIVDMVDDTYWRSAFHALVAGTPLPRSDEISLFAGSSGEHQGNTFCLTALTDSQQVFIEIGSRQGASVLGQPAGVKALDNDLFVKMYGTNADTVDSYCRHIRPDRVPRALGATPRLGIGARMTTALWPAAYRAMHAGDFAANTIQNSIRELHLLEDLLARNPPEEIYYPGFGSVESGHTGSTFEGLWVYGVLDALKSESVPAYGADADHIKVAPGVAGISAAKRWLNAARYYTFFTLDVSPVLDYHALRVDSPSAAEAYLPARIKSDDERRAVLDHHQQARQIAGESYRFDEAALGRLVGKYWDALEALEELAAHISLVRNHQPFDLEFAIDERPPEIATCECITTDDEVAFVLSEIQRRGIRVTHLAPNFGVEKGVDYRCPDGLRGLEKRVGVQYRMAAEFDVMLDFHSGDDLTAKTRRLIGRATSGRSHFKISPEPQMIFAETVSDLAPELFQRWWGDALEYARREAAAGSQFAAECIREREAAGDAVPSVRDSIFHNFGFAFVGQRDASGRYLHREELYSLPASFYDEYQGRIEAYLCELAEDLFHPPAQ